MWNRLYLAYIEYIYKYISQWCEIIEKKTRDEKVRDEDLQFSTMKMKDEKSPDEKM